jgi:hypothetical protein
MNDRSKTRAIVLFRGDNASTLCYRAFLLDVSNHIFAVRFLIATNHTSALQLAQRIQAPCDMIEVWYGTTKLGLIVPRNKMG